ncbi:MAG: ABC transporter permease [Elusimicrobia bacterium]|nr:ABC transporter permease [Elusimicrobiota bacterium]
MKRFPPLLKVYCGMIYLFLYLPMGVMMAFSFNDARRNVVWKGFTLKWYGKLFANKELMASLATTIELGLIATAISVALGMLASYALARHVRMRGRSAYAGLLNVPMMMPEIVLGIGILTFLVRAQIELSFWTLVLSHVVFCLPYATGAIRARLLSLQSSSYEDAAMDLGATEWEAFYKITLPLTGPAILSGALLAFTVSFEDFVTSFFVAGGGIETLPIRIYAMMKFGITPEINAMATVLLVFTLAVLAAYHAVSGGDQESAL